MIAVALSDNAAEIAKIVAIKQLEALSGVIIKGVYFYTMIYGSQSLIMEVVITGSI